jgi:thymidylate synthase (FAD)
LSEILIPCLDKGHVSLGSREEDVMGTDLKVVNAARVSFASRATEMNERHVKLIKFLAEHGHTSPFRHAAMSFRVKIPLFVAAQWRTHMVASALQSELHSYNETSARYVEMKEDFYEPKVWRSQAKSNRQASGEDLAEPVSTQLHIMQSAWHQEALTLYRSALSVGASREMARMFLPPSLYTEFMWTASLHAIAHFIFLRDSEHAQAEIQEYARAIKQIAEQFFPNSIATLCEHGA